MRTPATIADIIKDHSERLRCYHCGSDEEKIAHIIRDYHDHATEAIGKVKAFRDDLQTWLRAIALVLEMTGNASTHAEKNARLRGALELLESAIGKLRDHEIEFSMSYRFNAHDVFRSDYPTRHFLERIRELEHELKEARKTCDHLDVTVTEDGGRCNACGMDLIFDRINQKWASRA